MDIYNQPEEANLETIGTIDWGSGDYGFDLTCVWRHTLTRQFFYADDSGCSCPSPFEDTEATDLIPITSMAQLREHLDARQAESRERDRSTDIVTLVERLHGLGLR